jgi:small subunit ribosomal protein S6
MRTYELVMIFDPALEVEQIESDLRKVHDAIGAAGTVRRWERWGKRRLAYEIKGRQYGYYVLVAFDAQPGAVAELERSVTINASVVRHLMSAVDPKRVPEVDAESVRTLGAAPEAAAAAPEAAAAAPEADAGSPTEEGTPEPSPSNEMNDLAAGSPETGKPADQV